MFDIVGLLILAALATFGAWLITRARRAKHGAVKWIGLVLSGVMTLAFTLAICVALFGYYKLNFPRGPAVVEVKVAGTPEQLARGARFAAVCAGCHSPDGKPPLVGRNFLEGGGPPVGTMYAPNLTPGGDIKDWSDGEIIRAIREGVHKSGRALIIMPSGVFRNLSDSDVQSIVAYLRSQPATGATTPPAKLNALGAFLIGAMLPTAVQPAITQPVVMPAEGTSPEYGKYLVSVLACTECHGENLAGRPPGGLGPPAGPSLRAIVPNWTAENFIHTIRTGLDPSGRKLAPGMPWKEVSAFASDDDLSAMYAYLHSLPLNPAR
jgi:mono/diheme cytochrome c family protein